MRHNVAMPPSEPPKKRSRVHFFKKNISNAGLDKNLAHIYHGHGDLAQLERAKSPWKRRLLIGAITFLAVAASIAWAAFFVYRPDKGTYTGEGVSVRIDGPEEIESGAIVTYTVSVHNDGSDPLGSAGIHLRIPDVFHVISDSAGAGDITEAGDINVGAIPPNEERIYTMSGFFLTASEKTHDLQTVLTYHPVNFNAEFQAVATKSIRINGSVLDIAATGPKKTIAGETVAIEIVVNNPSEKEMRDVVVSAAYPPEFTTEKSTPIANDQNVSEWKIATLAPGKEVKIRLTGTFTSAAKGMYQLPFSVSLDSQNGLLFQEKVEVPVEVTEGDLLVALVINGRTEPQALAFGDNLRYSISYRNIGDSVLENVSMVLHLETTPNGVEVLSWNDLKDTKRGIRKGDTLTWTKKQVVQLGKIEPKSEGVIEMSIPIIKAPQSAGNDRNYGVTAYAEANVPLIDGRKVARVTKSSPVSVVLRSDTQLDGVARYYNDDGDALGSGPLPPEQGQATTYHVDFTVTNSLHELNDLVLSASLPDGVSIVGTPRADAGVVNVDAKSKTLQWTLNWMPLSVNTLSVGLDLSFTPTKAMVGKIPNILENISLTAKDKTLDPSLAKFTISMPAITTSLESDEKGAGKGKVE